MDTTEAKSILKEYLKRYRSRTYAELLKLLGRPEHFEIVGPSGKPYQVEVEVLRDDKSKGNLRALGSIDDGGWRSVVPICDGFTVSPSGKFPDQ